MIERLDEFTERGDDFGRRGGTAGCSSITHLEGFNTVHSPLWRSGRESDELPQARLCGATTTAPSLDGVSDAFGHALRRSRWIPHPQHDERREYPQSDKNGPGADRGQGEGEGQNAQAQDPSPDDRFLHEFGSHEISVLNHGNQGCSRMHTPRSTHLVVPYRRSCDHAHTASPDAPVKGETPPCSSCVSCHARHWRRRPPFRAAPLRALALRSRPT